MTSIFAGEAPVVKNLRESVARVIGDGKKQGSKLARHALKQGEGGTREAA